MTKSNGTASSDKALITLNQNIEKALKRYVDAAIGIRFDMVDKDNLPSDPTICVFLYDIQEDLEMRHGQPRHYQATMNQLTPRLVHVRCCYLLTYWEKSQSKPVLYDGQPVGVVNDALNALLNMQLPELPSTFVRVIAPSEHLSSLGNFWQSLGDKPRLCLNFTVTIPIQVGLDQHEKLPPVLSAELGELAEPWEQYDTAWQFKREVVKQVMAECAKDTEIDWVSVRTQLARLQVVCDYGTAEQPQERPVIRISGLLDMQLKSMVSEILSDEFFYKKWENFLIDGNGVNICQIV
ncbi:MULTISPECIES: DUF4255 domain-containing protein [unclassified Burkholderia]|uniref:DUF4255 domain-containing protein n=1 Tax=unclassified Burkholderia TaxID=2613784 RepID=UPI000ABCBA53|nr:MULTISPECIES: DUF4255 domain-containing protein [unclassified Burkholderia]